MEKSVVSGYERVKLMWLDSNRYLYLSIFNLPHFRRPQLPWMLAVAKFVVYWLFIHLLNLYQHYTNEWLNFWVDGEALMVKERRIPSLKTILIRSRPMDRPLRPVCTIVLFVCRNILVRELMGVFLHPPPVSILGGFIFFKSILEIIFYMFPEK